MFNRITFVIPLPPITKKNSMRIMQNRKTGKPFVGQSRQYTQYEEACSYFLKWPRGWTPVTTPVNVKCLFYMPTRRNVDGLNLCAAVDDILVKYGILKDDNRDVVAGHDGSRVYYDKENPRTEIEITPIPPEENYQQWKETRK